MLEVQEALDLLRANFKSQEAIVELPLLEALNKVLAQDIYSNIDVPGFPKAAMDGYALRSEDFKGGQPKKLRVIDQVMAGDNVAIEALENTAIRIMTGARIPDGYDAVVRQEDTDYGRDWVEVKTQPRAYDYYCPKGEDIQKGEKLIGAGTQLKPLHIGLLASIGLDYIPVVKDLKVGVLSTGSELLMPGSKLIPGHIYGNSAYILASYIRGSGLALGRFGICGDRKEELKEAILSYLEDAQVLITTGGVSVGDRDLMPEVLGELGEILFRRINIKPGTPVTACKIQDKLVLACSGNPFAAQVNFHALFWPYASHYYRSKDLDNRVIESTIASGEMKASKLRRYVRAHYSRGQVQLNEKTHESSVISNLDRCNALIIQEAGTSLGPGDKVELILVRQL